MQILNAADLRTVYETPVMRAVLDQVVKWERRNI